ncbi:MULTISPECIES: type IV pilin-like G/H family protein [unclassified Coleofasciculus]|uniref:type IV pilin-like G/H family protein n=1 Tax=unclassified Coleofasciculus TaxID=2692782 RepID=UPI0018815DEF|nr:MULTISPECIES: type IV pilin-like G/H family protein [unclassified Coleofasciculus]MBE9129305.1 type IV pilin-like G/H family protein [Coleofasciculus sp. LEGE 07081]MBE9151943.1 type IV pilin-like G/H family protein [Coleofasciculus sp. LEGE 07092]
MNSIIFHPLTSSRLFWMGCQLITGGLLLGLLATVATPIKAQTEIPPTVAEVEGTSRTNAIIERLRGEWQAQDPTTGEVVRLIFAPEDELFFILPAEDGSSVAIKTAYQIRTTTQPMQLDMAVTSDETALTIFELTPEGKLRVELSAVTPGQPRPADFSDTAALFERVSDATTVPESIQVLELESQTSSSSETVPIQYITLLSRAQQAYYLENSKFAADVEELGVITNLESELYRYQIVPQGDRTQSVAITAQPKESGLPSYIGAVFVTEVNGDRTTVTKICETEQPSTSPPPMPIPPDGDALEILCPVGSRSLQ